MILPFLFLSLFFAARAQNGPGSGPWQTQTPASQGLSQAELQEAADATNDDIRGRDCYLVIKNGYIVFEQYYDLWNQNSTRAGWSTTKSHCSSLYGIARQQGWANTSDLITDRNTDARNCNPNARFSHALTMTGESRNIDQPQFSYDTDGTQCLDTLSDFVDENNRGGLSTEDFKDRYWQNVLGMENFEWVNYLGYLHCGYTSETSCRDLARAAQLWLNEGVWDGEQVIARQHILEGRKWVYPTSGTEYGYTVWLNVNDPVDNEVHSFNGAYDQCAYISKKHEAIIVSMGDGSVSGAQCSRAWANSRSAIVSNDKKHTIRNMSEKELVEEDAKLLNRPAASDAELLSYRGWVEANPDKLTMHEIITYQEFLEKQGQPPLSISKYMEKQVKKQNTYLN
jgi:hypothetical protein